METKKFWSYIKHCKNDSVGVAPLLDNTTGVTHAESGIKATLLNRQFKDAFSPKLPMKLKHLCLQTLRTSQSAETPQEFQRKYPEMPEFTISTKGVQKLLDGLKPQKAAGSDHLRPMVLREISSAIAPTLQLIFHKSYISGIVPLDWKTANIAPIYKKGPKQLLINYRPVSLTCICSKLMEHIVASQITDHLTENNILFQNQHGFRSKLSCDTQPLEFIQDMHSNLHLGQQIDAVVMDFSKAFDKVAHNRLLYKLDFYGITGLTNGGLLISLMGDRNEWLWRERLLSLVVLLQVCHRAPLLGHSSF